MGFVSYLHLRLRQVSLLVPLPCNNFLQQNYQLLLSTKLYRYQLSNSRGHCD